MVWTDKFCYLRSPAVISPKLISAILTYIFVLQMVVPCLSEDELDKTELIEIIQDIKDKQDYLIQEARSLNEQYAKRIEDLKKIRINIEQLQEIYNRLNGSLANYNHLVRLISQADIYSENKPKTKLEEIFANLLYKSIVENETDFATFLIDIGAAENSNYNNSNTPLHLAAEKGQLDVVNKLINAGTSVMVANKDGMTPLHFASINGHLHVVKSLFKLYPHFDIKDENGSTPLHEAAGNGHLAIVAAILKIRPKLIDVKDFDERTPLHWASGNGHTAIVDELIKYGANIDATDNQLWTPLHWASFTGHPNVLEVLIESGANVFSLERDLKSVLQLSKETGRESVVSEIKKYIPFNFEIPKINLSFGPSMPQLSKVTPFRCPPGKLQIEDNLCISKTTQNS